VLPFFLGGVSGVISKTVTAPFERITIVLQVQDLKEKDMRYKGIILFHHFIYFLFPSKMTVLFFMKEFS
jgi:hypothetical protein